MVKTSKSHYDLLIITPSIDFALLEQLSEGKSIVLCEFSKIGRLQFYKIVCIRTGRAEKYYFPETYDKFAIARIIGEKIHRNFGVPKLVDFDLRVQPPWLGSYFSHVAGSQLLLRFSDKAKVDRRLSWLTGLSSLMITDTEESCKKMTASHINPIRAIPVFNNFPEKYNFFNGIYEELFSVENGQLLSNRDVARQLSDDVDRSNSEKKVLIISYCSPHGTALGAVRPTYWHRKFKEITGGKIESFFLTSLKLKDDYQNFYCIKDETVFNFPNHKEWKKYEQTLETLVSPQGATWALSVYKNIDRSILSKFDHVVITGNPFYLFNLPSFWGTWEKRPKFYLDYRDPFANNTRFKFSKSQRARVRSIEREWNSSVDKIIAVNDVCREMVVAKENNKVIVIENGFDEEKIKTSNSEPFDDGKIHFVYAGSVFRDRSVVPLIKALDPQKHVFHIAGRIADYRDEIENSDVVRYHGLLSYEDVCRLVSRCHVSVLLLSGCSFVSTTKIYDYIALNKFVLALSDFPENEETFQRDFKSYTEKTLLKNEVEEIKKYVLNLSMEDLMHGKEVSQVEVYSRRYSTKRLADSILGAEINERN